MDKIELIDLTEDDDYSFINISTILDNLDETSHSQPSDEASTQTVTLRESSLSVESEETPIQNATILESTSPGELSHSQNETQLGNPFSPVVPRSTSDKRKKRKVKGGKDGLRHPKRIRMGGALTDIGCPICLETIENLIIQKVFMSDTKCGHSFCNTCLLQWQKVRGRKCPICRQSLQVVLRKHLIQF